MSRAFKIWPGLAVFLGLVSVCRAGYIDHDFEVAPFVSGTNFMSQVLQWRASTPGVVVVNTKAASGSQSVLVPDGGAISNEVSVSSPGVVWTDIQIAPCPGVAPDASVTSGVAVVQYFGSNGYLHVWSGGGWLVCSNDVWGQPVPQVAEGVFASLSIYQNFASQTAAILLNDQVVVQDLPFLGNFSDYGSFKLGGAESDAWLDDVYIQPTYATARHTQDKNGVDGADAGELETYGYVARTLSVGAGETYTTLAAALAVARDRDTLNVDGRTVFAETVSISHNLTITGGVFTNSGTITVAAGKTLTLASGFLSSLSVAGTVILNAGAVVSGATVSVTGTILAGTGQVLAGGLSITAGGTVTSTGGRVSASGVDMAGTFTLDHTFGSQAVAGLEFFDDFELYAADSRMMNLGFRGWSATSTGVLVKASLGLGGSKGVELQDETSLSNQVSCVGQPKIWTDFYIRPVLGDVASTSETNRQTFLSFVGTNGYLNVWDAGTWAVCSNYMDGSPVVAMDTGSYTRVSVFLNFGSHYAAVFVAGKLVRQLLPFPSGVLIPSYGGLQTVSQDGRTGLDNVQITTNAPADLTSDLNNNGRPDAGEIHANDALFSTRGSIYRFR